MLLAQVADQQPEAQAVVGGGAVPTPKKQPPAPQVPPAVPSGAPSVTPSVGTPTLGTGVSRHTVTSGPRTSLQGSPLLNTALQQQQVMQQHLQAFQQQQQKQQQQQVLQQPQQPQGYIPPTLFSHPALHHPQMKAPTSTLPYSQVPGGAQVMNPQR